MNKLRALERLKRKMENDATLPLRESNLVFGEGDPDAVVLFIGEAPGRNEDVQKRPFVGQAGKLLDATIARIGWERKNVYITNIVKRRPPKNRDPFPEEITAYMPYLEKQIEIINPKIIATLGRFSMNCFVPDVKISESHGKPIRQKNHIIFPIYHPAAARRSLAMMEAFEKDFKRLLAVVKKCDIKKTSR
jgi:DNA polymerase